MPDTMEPSTVEKHDSLEDCLDDGRFDEQVEDEQTRHNHLVRTSCPVCDRGFEWIYSRSGIFDKRSSQYVDTNQVPRIDEEAGYFSSDNKTYSVPLTEDANRELVFSFEQGYSFTDEESIDVVPDVGSDQDD